MAFSISLFVLLMLLSLQCSSSLLSLNKGSSLSVEKHSEDVILSRNQMFCAGFVQLAQNAFSFAVWFNEPHSNNTNTVVWMANREQPVNGKLSKLWLLNSGNLVLLDAAQITTWSSNTASHTQVTLLLHDDGNLVLRDSQGTILWQSFDSPTDTLLPGQPLTRFTQLVSSRSETNHSSGFYKLRFDDDNVLRLIYDGPYVSSQYWPQPWLLSWEAGRFNYNSTRIAVLDSLGNFTSSDNYGFSTNDYGLGVPRRLKLDCDGNVRVYSRNDKSKQWYVSRQVIFDACSIHGICGANSTCDYDHERGRRCSCLPGYRVKNHSDWSYGCEPMFDLSCNRNESTFSEIRGVEFYGYDSHYAPNTTFTGCVNLCLEDCNCIGFQYRYDGDKGFSVCYTKLQFLNGRSSPSYTGSIYVRLANSNNDSRDESATVGAYDHFCSVESVQLHRDYVRKVENRLVRFFLWLATAVGGLELVGFLMIWGFLIRTRQKSGADQQGYHLAEVAFRKYSYSELKEATKGFSEEIGRGGGGVVYKGILSDQRHAAIKRLYEAKQGEGEFLAEVSIIGRLNHMNLIEMWGYCAEGKHRLLVYEYMENGSLAQKLSSNTLDWSKRYNIALGVAKVLAYLHEECLEWILHCDIKPQNILLDASYEPKVADFGLSKLLNRNTLNNNSSFSMIRGTRGYMAPEWVYNLPITSKVDVYSYGIVLLEMITGKSPTMDIETVDGTEAHNGRLVTWVRGKQRRNSWVEEIMDPTIGTYYDVNKMEILATVALDCVEEDKDVRPTMKQVVEFLQSQES
ncbi:putative receptor protein kinase ZmPK1 [Cajanus cajan]|uniref:Receptor-like serine/threonine-protein kinase n=2 Tax=Cajanus cajan TaxID=3821 RepID=A0A151S5X0_CAJCA|nr:putative receptor protein kinase ZmPK1 [Cajanus cajan]KYP50158.1 Putative receptor protein kinase ZmPK1 [Cajanus cajan]